MRAIQVLHETPDFLVLNKPPGMGMHSESGPGLIVLLRDMLGTDRLFPVHRLDAVTSGLLLIAKNTQANSELSQLFEQKSIEKFYLALLDKKPRKSQGSVIGDMQQARRGSWRLARSKTRPAITWFFTYAWQAGKRVAILKPLTGKTHQIRVAMKAMGAPIVGDRRYGGTQAGRTCLHAWCLRFFWQGREQVFQAPFAGAYSDDTSELGGESLQSFVDSLGSPLALPWPRAAQTQFD